jgi:hypothetical protein
MGCIKVSFASLSGKFEIVRKSKFEGPNRSNDAVDAVVAHASAGGFTNIKIVTDDEHDGWRYTARTPGGREGRNVAFGEICDDE